MSEQPSANPHTPGPWRIVKTPRKTWSKPRWRIHADKNNRPHGRHSLTFIGIATVHQTDADAFLISAAPDGLDAARIALVELEAVEREIGVPSKAVPLLRAFIAKATGSSA